MFETGHADKAVPVVKLTALIVLSGRNFMQNLNIESGSTIVVASFDQETRDRDSTGPFDPRFWGLGGVDGYSAQDTKIIVMMTPVVLESQNQPKARR